MKQRRWLLVAVVLATASTVALWVLKLRAAIPSTIGEALDDFVQPGTAIWWLVLGGPFRSMPSSPGGIAFAAVTNAMFWVLLCWLAALALRVIRRITRAA